MLVLRRIRTRAACYAAAITIILEQLSSFPAAELSIAPPPLVRIHDRPDESDTWHPDELVRQRSGDLAVLVWEQDGRSHRVSRSAEWGAN